MRHRARLAALASTALLLLAACAEKPESKPAAQKAAGRPPVLITTAEAGTRSFELGEETLATLESLYTPRIAAEVSGRLVRLAVASGMRVRKGQRLAEIDPADLLRQQAVDSAEVARLQALLAQQERVLARQTELFARQFISRHAVDEATAQRDALTQQLAGARSRAAQSAANVGKARIDAPFDGIVEEPVLAAGSYVKAGDAILRLVADRELRALLPLPETSAAQVRIGQSVVLTPPQAGAAPRSGRIVELRPTLAEGSRTLTAIAHFADPESTDGNAGSALPAGASLRARIITGVRSKVVAVPEQAVVLRPAGSVVYTVSAGKAQQQRVRTGARQNGFVEITEGLAAGSAIAVDGAGFLSDGAAVSVAQSDRKSTPPAAARP